jgi:hypothetical protein
MLVTVWAVRRGWETMEYEEFLRERRQKMAEIIRVAFRQLGGEPDSPPLTPPWFTAVLKEAPTMSQ